MLQMVILTALCTFSLLILLSASILFVLQMIGGTATSMVVCREVRDLFGLSGDNFNGKSSGNTFLYSVIICLMSLLILLVSMIVSVLFD